jgi:hypothetical protein
MSLNVELFGARATIMGLIFGFCKTKFTFLCAENEKNKKHLKN